jgi:type IV secretion system protein VirB8
MGLEDNIKKIKGKLSLSQSKDVLSATKNWYSDRYESMQVQRNAFLLLACVFSFAISALMLGIWYYTSKTTIEPFVIEIEPKSGVTTVVYPLESKALSDDEAIRRYFVWKYVKLREEYFAGTFDLAFPQVALYSNDNTYATFFRMNNKNNKQSPINTFGLNGTRQIEMKSFTFLKPEVAQVRFKVIIQGVPIAASDRIATVDFVFDNKLLNEEQRFLNPLGFYVNNYTVEEEYNK